MVQLNDTDKRQINSNDKTVIYQNAFLRVILENPVLRLETTNVADITDASALAAHKRALVSELNSWLRAYHL